MDSNPNKKECTYCHQLYSKKDFHVCPHCGGDGGSRTVKEWRPTKHQKKEYIKKIKNEN